MEKKLGPQPQFVKNLLFVVNKPNVDHLFG